MNVLYHLTSVPPKIPAGEAYAQEIALLRTRFPGEVVYLNPNHPASSWRLPVPIPRGFFGYHLLARLREMERGVDLHHLYNADAYPFPIVRRLRKPLLYVISSGVGLRRPNLRYFGGLAAVAVPDERSLTRLVDWGLENAHLIRPGIDTTRFRVTRPPAAKPFRLLVASAPWTYEQFASKGIDLLLIAAAGMPDLHVTFLWRGVLADEMKEWIAALELAERVTLIDGYADVPRLLEGVHAAVALADREGIVKSYPHSLIDSLAAGRPVLTSRAVPMSDYVEQTGCGEVIEELTLDDFQAGIERLRGRYAEASRAAERVGQADFSADALLDSVAAIYQAMTGRRSFALPGERAA